MRIKSVKSDVTGTLKAIKNAFYHSIDGIHYLLEERAFRHELMLGVTLTVCEFFRDVSCITRLYLLMAYILVLVVEALNTAIEAVVDRIGPEKHELSKQAKDIGSAAVFLALLHLGVVWIFGWLRHDL